MTLDIAAIKARADKATAGPWAWNSRHGLGAPNRLVMWPSHEYGCDLDIEGEEADLDFIAHARQDIPDMIAALEAAERERDDAQKALRTVQNAAKTLAHSRDSELQHLRENSAYDHKLRAEHDSLIERDALMTARVTALEAALSYYAKEHKNPSEGPWGLTSTDFGNVARRALAR